MSTRVQVTVVLFSIALSIFIIELLRRRKINEEYCLWWLFITISTALLILNQRLLFFITRLIGVMAPISTMILFSFVFVLAMLIYFSMQNSLLTNQVRELVQTVAILKRELNDISKDRGK